jgi:hypothetical protein
MKHRIFLPTVCLSSTACGSASRLGGVNPGAGPECCHKASTVPKLAYVIDDLVVSNIN